MCVQPSLSQDLEGQAKEAVLSLSCRKVVQGRAWPKQCHGGVEMHGDGMAETSMAGDQPQQEYGHMQLCDERS